MRQYLDWFWALVSGGLLALMITINSALAGFTTPFIASWVVHGVGAVAALVLVLVYAVLVKRRPVAAGEGQRPPLWSYFGGAPGALAVALSSIAVNSELALAGALSLLLVGQILFGLLSDRWGLFGTPQRPINRFDILASVLVIAGSALLIYSGTL